MRIGVYGGTFNPIHRGHLTAARAAADALGLEKVLLIPDSLPPHKELPAGSATGEDRLAMCRLTAGEVRAEFDKGSERALAYAKQCERAVSGLLRDEDFYFGVTEGTV